MSNPAAIKQHPWVHPKHKQAHPKLSDSLWLADPSLPAVSVLSLSHHLCLTRTRNQLLLHLFYPQPLIPFYSHSNYTITLPFLFAH